MAFIAWKEDAILKDASDFSLISETNAYRNETLIPNHYFVKYQSSKFVDYKQVKVILIFH